MTETEDISLLRRYTEENSEAAFATLVERHINKVYSVALRHTRNPHQAEEITQAVFVILVKKARSLGKRVILSGWLYQAARLTSVTFLRSEIRRKYREQEAHMQNILDEPPPDETWAQIAPLLDAAMAKLNEADRNAVVLRFFDGKSMSEVGAALGASEEAAKKRVNRALEKLHKFFTKRGVVSTTAIIAGTISSHSVQAAPAALGQTISAVALAKGAAASASTLTLVKGALKVMAWTKAKTVLAIGVGLLLAAGAATETIKQIQKTRFGENQWRRPDITSDDLDSLSPEVDILPTIFPQRGDAAANGRKFLGIRQSVADVVSVAYNWPQARMIFPEGAPPGQYDYVATLAGGSREALRDKIKDKLGLVGHNELKNENALLLIMQNPNAPGLHPSIPGSTDNMIVNGNRVEIKWQNERIAKIDDYLQEASPLPIVDATGTTERYSIDITWVENLRDPEHTALQNVLREQLGLVLVPTNMPIEMLVVEKAN
jgi:uncharacterized protein (TIGR03435 family)